MLSPLVLLLARLVQGFSAGGEFGSSSAFLVESAAPGRRAFAGSWQQVSVAGGVLIASLLGTIFTSTLSDDALHSWGWRLAFILGGLLGLVGLWLRVSVEDTESFTETQGVGSYPRPTRSRRCSCEHPAAALRVAGITIAGTLTYYMWVNYLPTYANLATGIPLKTALLSQTLCLVIFVVLLPFAGLLSDRVGRKPTMAVFAGGFVVLAWPLLHLLGNSFLSLFLVQLTGMLLVLGYSANCAVIMAEQFPPEVRATGIALPYALAVAVFGGTAPYLTTWLHESGHSDLLWIYVSAASLDLLPGLRHHAGDQGQGVPLMTHVLVTGAARRDRAGDRRGVRPEGATLTLADRDRAALEETAVRLGAGAHTVDLTDPEAPADLVHRAWEPGSPRHPGQRGGRLPVPGHGRPARRDMGPALRRQPAGPGAGHRRLRPAGRRARQDGRGRQHLLGLRATGPPRRRPLRQLKGRAGDGHHAPPPWNWARTASASTPSAPASSRRQRLQPGLRGVRGGRSAPTRSAGPATPRDIARAVVLDRRPDASWITGEILRVDGGSSTGALHLPRIWPPDGQDPSGSHTPGGPDTPHPAPRPPADAAEGHTRMSDISDDTYTVVGAGAIGGTLAFSLAGPATGCASSTPTERTWPRSEPTA